MKKLVFSFIFSFFLGAAGFAQDTIEAPTIDQKFEELIENSNNFKQYEVVNTRDLIALQELTSARITALKEEIAASEKAMLSYKQQIAQLNTDLEGMEGKLQQVTENKDSINFIGIGFSKGSFKGLVWFIILALLAALGFFIFRFQRSNVLTKEAQENLAELENEFSEFRTKALEKEQRMGRLLQDEKNKQARMSK